MKHYHPAATASGTVRKMVDATENLFVPHDVALAHRIFKANCGPAALAAVMERRVCDVMEFFPQFPERPWTTQTQMSDALHGLGLNALSARDVFPVQGVALLQFTGPWMRAGVPKIVHLKHTHWVGMRSQFIYDINAHAWLPIADWERRIFPKIAAAHPGCDGWAVKVGFDLTTLWGGSAPVPAVSNRIAFASRPTAYSR